MIKPQSSHLTLFQFVSVEKKEFWLQQGNATGRRNDSPVRPMTVMLLAYISGTS